MVFHLIRAFHVSLFLKRCHMALFIWCCHIAWTRVISMWVVMTQRLYMSFDFIFWFSLVPHHQLEINFITNIWLWSIRWFWIHYKILMSTNAPTSRFGFAPDSNARKMRLEVFYFIYNFIFRLSSMASEAFIYMKYCLPPSQCCKSHI